MAYQLLAKHFMRPILILNMTAAQTEIFGSIRLEGDEDRGISPHVPVVLIVEGSEGFCEGLDVIEILVGLKCDARGRLKRHIIIRRPLPRQPFGKELSFGDGFV